MKIKNLLMAILITSLLVGCGFHVRQEFQLPVAMTPVQLKVPRKQRELAAILQEEMRNAKIPLTNSSSSAALVIDLRQVVEEENLLTASATGSPL